MTIARPTVHLKVIRPQAALTGGPWPVVTGCECTCIRGSTGRNSRLAWPGGPGGPSWGGSSPEVLRLGSICVPNPSPDVISRAARAACFACCSICSRRYRGLVSNGNQMKHSPCGIVWGWRHMCAKIFERDSEWQHSYKQLRSWYS